MNISYSNNSKVSFTDEELDILTKARDILKDTAHKLFVGSHSDEDEEMSWCIGDIRDGLTNMIDHGNPYE